MRVAVNEDHVFMRWFINNVEKIKTNFPWFYKSFIRGILCMEGDFIIETVNKFLELLKQLPNRSHIKLTLFDPLTKADFWE